MKIVSIPSALAAALLLSACEGGPLSIEGTQRYSGPNSVIATSEDQGSDPGVLSDGRAAVAYTPDGCQVWVIDDGVEGYASQRNDPVSGLPICNNRFPPGTVVGNYTSGSEGIEDAVSGPAEARRP